MDKEIDLRALGPELLTNDLEKAVVGRFSEIGVIKEALGRYGAWGTLMSGSGSTVFGIYFEERRAQEAQCRIEANYAERAWTVAAVPALL